MNARLFFDPGPPDPNNDAAPLAGGAGVNDSNTSPDSIRLRLVRPARLNAPAGTSYVGAQRIVGHAAEQPAQVLAVIVSAGVNGATDADVEVATGLRAQSVSPRRGELVKLKLIADSGTRRPTPRGRPAAVWMATTLSTGGPAPAGEPPKAPGLRSVGGGQ